jgi:two-component system, NtrC family, sensor histidine kinase HydH
MNANDKHVEDATAAIVQRTRERFDRYRRRTVADTDRLFAKLLVAQWLFAVGIALVFSPYAWSGKTKVVHLHVWIALFLGAVLISFPIALALRKPGAVITRHVIAVAQMLMSALLIHLSGGRIETHFHVFGSLAFLAFYLDWAVLLTAAVTIAIDHIVRGLVWPESVYGIVNPEWWRFLEHAFWVVFCTTFLIVSCRRHLREWLAAAEEGGMIEAMAESEWRQSSVVDRAKKSAGADK